MAVAEARARARRRSESIQTALRVPGGLPAARERLLRYCARPPLALERLSVLDDGKVCYRIKDTDQVRLMTPVQFLARLAALVPPPRHPLVRFYGVWAPHSQWRSRVVTLASAKKTRVCATSTVTDLHATPVTPAGSFISFSSRGWSQHVEHRRPSEAAAANRSV